MMTISNYLAKFHLTLHNSSGFFVKFEFITALLLNLNLISSSSLLMTLPKSQPPDITIPSHKNFTFATLLLMGGLSPNDCQFITLIFIHVDIDTLL